MSRAGVMFLALAAGVLGATGFYVTRRGQRSAPEGHHRIVHAERRTITSTVNATGTIRLRVGSEVRVGSQLSGIVNRLNVTVGAHVRAGDVIAEIDDRPLDNDVAVVAFSAAALNVGFALWPSRRAARLNPAEALRYE